MKKVILALAAVLAVALPGSAQVVSRNVVVPYAGVDVNVADSSRFGGGVFGVSFVSQYAFTVGETLVPVEPLVGIDLSVGNIHDLEDELRLQGRAGLAVAPVGNIALYFVAGALWRTEESEFSQVLGPGMGFQVKGVAVDVQYLGFNEAPRQLRATVGYTIPRYSHGSAVPPSGGP